MSHRSHAAPDVACAFFRYEGAVDVEEFVQVLEELAERPELRDLPKSLHDFRAVGLSFSTEELRRIGNIGLEFRRRMRGRGKENWRTATLHRTDLAYGLGRMLEVFVECPAGRSDRDFRVFREYEDAAQWLELPAGYPHPFEEPDQVS